MKTLLVLRHAKSSRDGVTPDHERPLAARGKEDAPVIGRRIDEMDLNPHIVISSDARRAHQTARYAAEAFSYDPEDIMLTGRLYASNVVDHLEVLHDISDENDIAMIVGHNPVFEDLVEFLTDEMVALVTSNVAHIELDVDSWLEVDEGCGELVAVYHPNPARDL